MTTQVADAVLGKIARQYNDLFRRVREGTLEPEGVSNGLQALIEGKFAAEAKPTIEIRIPALSRIAKSEICSRYGFKSVERDNSPTEEVIMVLESVLRDDENSISWREYESRLRTVSGQLGLSQALWVVEHQDVLPAEFMALLGKVYIDFPATIAVCSDGYRSVPFLNQNGSRWYLNWHWLDNGFSSDGRVARSRK